MKLLTEAAGPRKAVEVTETLEWLLATGTFSVSQHRREQAPFLGGGEQCVQS